MFKNQSNIPVIIRCGNYKRNIYVHFLPNVGDSIILTFYEDGIRNNFIITKIEHDIQDLQNNKPIIFKELDKVQQKHLLQLAEEELNDREMGEIYDEQ